MRVRICETRSRVVYVESVAEAADKYAADEISLDELSDECIITCYSITEEGE